MLCRWLVTGTCIALAGCSSVNSALQPNLTAVAMIAPTAGNQVKGTVKFTQDGQIVLADARLEGLPPNSVHGMHIHEKGDCRAPDASSAGGHFNPHGTAHGGPDTDVRHGGDLGNVESDENGVAVAQIAVSGISLGTGNDSIIGRAVIVHAQADDLVSQPSGNAGPRIACGLISKNPDKFF